MDTACSLVVTSDEGYVTSGYGQLVKIDINGAMEWNRTYSGKVKSLIATSDGGYAFIVGSQTWIKTDEQGIMQWKQRYEIEGFLEVRNPISLIQTSDGGYAVAGDKFIGFFGTTVIWVVKTDVHGIPEFPSWMVLPLFFVVTASVLLVKRKLTKT